MNPDIEELLRRDAVDYGILKSTAEQVGSDLDKLYNDPSLTADEREDVLNQAIINAIVRNEFAIAECGALEILNNPHG